MSQPQPFDYPALEMRLATALGWTGLQVGGIRGGLNIPKTWLTGFFQGEETASHVPKWTNSSSESFDLLVEHGLSLDASHPEYVVVSKGAISSGPILYAEHLSKSRAAASAVVLATLAVMSAASS